MLKKLFTAALAMACAGASHAQSLNTPESVEYDAAGNRYFISNKGAGEILARSATGSLSVFTSIPSNPHGLHIQGNTLYVCDNGRVRGYDLATAAEVMNIYLGASFLNGITGDGGTNLYVTDFTAKKIYRVNTATQSFNLFVPSLTKSPNGIIYDAANSRLIFVCWGSSAPIYEVLLSDSSVNQVTSTSLSSCDGITRDCSGRYYVTAWGGMALYRFDSAFASPPVTVLTGLNSPADICYNAAGDTIAIPNSGNNTISFYHANCTGLGVEENVSLEVSEMYPVPTTDVLTVKIKDAKPGEEVRCSFYNAEGKLIREYAEVFGSEGKSFYIEDLSPGVYFAAFSYGGKVVTEKFVKQ